MSESAAPACEDAVPGSPLAAAQPDAGSSEAAPAAVMSEPAQPGTAPMLPRARSDLCALALVALLLCLVSPHFPKLFSANENSRLLLADALVVERVTSIGGAIKRLADTQDKSRRAGRLYSDKAPGTAFLAVPAVALYRAIAAQPTLDGEMRAARFTAATLPTLLLLALLLAFLAERGVDARLRFVLALGYGLGSPALTYGILLFGHQLSALLLFWTYLIVRRATPTRQQLGAAVGALAAAAVVAEYQNALYLLPLGVLFFVRVRLAPRVVAAGLLGAAPFAALLAAYHQAAFGSPFLTGYSFLANSFAGVHARGFMGIELPTLEHLFLSFLPPHKGLLYFAPWLGLGVIGAIAFARRDVEARRALVATVFMAAFVSAMVFPDGGWTVSQRHLAPLVPWLALPAGLLVQRAPMLAPVLVGLVAASVFVTGLPTAVYPYLHDLTNPLRELVWPAFQDGLLPPNLLSPLVATKTVLVLAALIVVGALLAVTWRRAQDLRRAAVDGLAAAAVCAAYVGVALLVGQSTPAQVRAARADLEARYVGVVDPRSAPIAAR